MSGKHGSSNYSSSKLNSASSKISLTSVSMPGLNIIPASLADVLVGEVKRDGDEGRRKAERA